MSRQVEGIDRAASRYRQAEAMRLITQHASSTTITQPPTTTREVPDHTQVIGIPLIIQHTPAWHRQDWATPQHAPTRPILGTITIATRKDSNA